MHTYRVEVIKNGRVVRKQEFSPERDGCISDSYCQIDAIAWRRVQMEKGAEETRFYMDNRLMNTWSKEEGA